MEDQEQPQSQGGVWSRFKNVFRPHDTERAISEMAKSDHVDQDIAEFRVAKDRLREPEPQMEDVQEKMKSEKPYTNISQDEEEFRLANERLSYHQRGTKEKQTVVQKPIEEEESVSGDVVEQTTEDTPTPEPVAEETLETGSSNEGEGTGLRSVGEPEEPHTEGDEPVDIDLGKPADETPEEGEVEAGRFPKKLEDLVAEPVKNEKGDELFEEFSITVHTPDGGQVKTFYNRKDGKFYASTMTSMDGKNWKFGKRNQITEGMAQNALDAFGKAEAA